MKAITMVQKTIMFSGWSIIMVVCTLLFTVLGFKIDNWLGTPPLFMTGLLILSFILICIRMFNEAMSKIRK